MTEAIAFSIVVLSFFVPLFVMYILSQYQRIPAIFKVIIVAVGIIAVAGVQYAWAVAHSPDFLSWWIMYLVVMLFYGFLAE